MAILNMFPAPNFSGTGGLNFASQAPSNTPRREEMLRMDYQASDNWRITGRYMNTMEDIVQAYGTTWAGNGSDQLPTPTLFLHPGSNYMMSATGILSPTMSLEVSWGRAANQLNYGLQEDRLFLANNPAMAQLPAFYPDALQGDYVPWFQFRGGRTGNVGQYQTDRGPFTNKNVTHDVVANLTKVAGSHAMKAGFYYQNSFKPQSIFASFNRSISFNEDVNNNVVRHELRLLQRRDRRVQHLHAGLEVRHSRVALPQRRVLRPGQLEGRQQADARLRRPLLLPHAAVGRVAPGVELHPERVRSQQRGPALRAGLHRRVAVHGQRPSSAWTRVSSRRASRRRRPTPWLAASSAA